MTAPIVIVGAGECGVRAAFGLREAGFEGEVVLVGEETALPYERPPLSKEVPVANKQIAPEQKYAEAGIELRRGSRVNAVERSARYIGISNGERLRYSKLLLATGARPRIFDTIARTATLRTAQDALNIIGALERGASLIVVGGGFIGLELAATASKLGRQVNVVEASDRLMARAVPETVAARAHSRHQEMGVVIRTGTAVSSATANVVTLVNGETLEADIVVAGVGSVPNIELAQRAGLETPNGIRVNERFMTSDPNIFAAGDCCCFPYRGDDVRLESWRAAQEMGTHVANSILGHDEPYAKVPWFWSDQHDLTLQVAGLPGGRGLTLRRDIDRDSFLLFELDDAGALCAASGIGPGNRIAKDIRLAEMMIERAVRPDPGKLSDPHVNLKSLVRG